MTPVRAKRPLLFEGLRLVLRHPGAVVWTYALNLGLALVFSFSLDARLSNVLDHSMAAQGLNAQFDLGTLGAVSHQLSYRVPSAGAAGYLGLPLYLLAYFLLVPGALVALRDAGPARLGTLVATGIAFFWRFVRVTVLMLAVSAPLLGVLAVANARWSDWVLEHRVGGAQLWYRLPVWILFLLVAALLRLYFDLVEVYTVQLDTHPLPSGKPDRRVRKALIPAAKTLWRNLPRAYATFVFLALLGVAAILATAIAAFGTIPQPRVWPAFLLLQAGLFLNLFTRYWQRAAETILAGGDPLDYALALDTHADVAQHDELAADDPIPFEE